MTLPALRFGRDIVSDSHGREREWLVTNGLGGYASASVCGMPTRGYHGLLVAALAPPVDRRVLIPAVIEQLECCGQVMALTALRWHDGTVAPDTVGTLLELRLEGNTPVWTYDSGVVALERRLWMEDGAQATRIDYRVLRAPGPVRMHIGVLTDCRDYHGRSFASEWLPPVSATGDTLTAVYGAVKMHAVLENGAAEADVQWWRGFDLAQERARGLTDQEDHVMAGRLSVDLHEGHPVQLVLSTGDTAVAPDPAAWAREQARQERLLSQAGFGASAPDWVQRLVLSADMFIARRTLRDGTPAHTVMAGFHWFADWGRDTMISLPGLALVTGRADIADSILRAFADVIDQGMIPNRFPDAGDAPEFNTVDATFWFIEAISALDRAAPDPDRLAALFPLMQDIVEHLRRGTRYGIVIDPADGLVRAGADGMQLTWMDARVGEWVVTPRRGKPVEVNALWISALRFMVDAAQRLALDAEPYQALLTQALAGFQRFWNPARGFLFDVLDGPDGHEDLLRPNQILAARASTGALTPEQAAAVVAVCEARLWTPCGLRSLAEGEPGYVPHYRGDQVSRDAAYHMGTVWAWLIGPFIEAHLDVHHDAERALQFLRPMADQLRIAGLGSISEIFEAQAPHEPRGCIAQAWSVAEMLRACALIESAKRPAHVN